MNLVKSDSLRLATGWQRVFGLHSGSDVGTGPNLTPSVLPGCFVVLVFMKLTQVMKVSLIGAIHPSSACCESQFKQALLLLFHFFFPVQDGREQPSLMEKSYSQNFNREEIKWGS